ncbi:ATP-binding protein [Rhodopseudomonas sp. B29]|uniref:ATP-binding protein n=1 Tax=Rhodopseudomonas sp. B29 TaxID=95607 RepID=UPI0003B5BF5E|nr:ATP-binding protein [Rhodopseudomonas sp. B29]
MSYVLDLPSQFDGTAISTFAADAAKLAANGSWPPEVAINFATLRFIRPAGIVFLSNLVGWLNEQGTKVIFQNIDITGDAVRFLDDSLFFEQHCGAKRRLTAAPRATTRPLMKIAHSHSHDWLRNDLIPWLSDRLGINQGSLYSFQTCLSELFNNIQDHTRYDIGTIFAQHFPKEKRVYVTLSDFGIGIPTNVRKVVPQLSDSQAIVKATEDGFTTKTTPRNRGIGLDYLLKQVVGNNGGTVTFYSGLSAVRFEQRFGNVGHQELWTNGFCPGTTVDIVLKTDNIKFEPDEPENLEW